MSVDYRAHSNKHPSKHKLESCASSFAAEFVKNLLTIGYIPTAEAAQKHTWIAKPVNGKKLLRVDVKHPSLQHTAENCWVVVSLVHMGDDRYQLFLPNDVPRNTTVNRFLVKRVPLSTYYAREKEYEKEINMLNNLHSVSVSHLKSYARERDLTENRSRASPHFRGGLKIREIYIF